MSGHRVTHRRDLAGAPIDLDGRKDLRDQLLGRYSNHLDGDAPTVDAAYRARLVVDDTPSPWSPVATAADVVPTDAPSPDGPCAPAVLDEVLDLVNAARHAAGVAVLADDASLDLAAARRSAAIADLGQLTHDGWIAVIRAAGYAGAPLGENIAMGYPSAASVVAGWLASGPHRANLLNPYFQDSGVGCTLDRGGRLWWVHDFGG